MKEDLVQSTTEGMKQRGDHPVTEICSRRGKLIGGCRFEARYDLSAADMSGFTEIRGGFNLEPLREKTYRGDVCVRCGKIVNGGK